VRQITPNIRRGDLIFLARYVKITGIKLNKELVGMSLANNPKKVSLANKTYTKETSHERR